jgi:outer membrane receptor protein involved in Fe transport
MAQQILEEVLVVAQKRTQNLQDVPVAVSAISAKELQISGVRDMFDLGVIATGLDARPGVNVRGTKFRIRGVGTFSINFGLESAVGLYVDGVYRSRQGSLINNLVDLEGVEVLRGPQGTLFGRNTLAGAVLVKTVAPDHFGGDNFVELTAGNYDLLEFSGAASLSAIKDVLAFRFTGFSSQRDGYVDDIGPGDGKIYDRDRWGARLQALYTPTDRLSLRIIADYSEIDEVCCGSMVVQDNLRPVALSPGEEPYAGTDEILRALGGTVYTGSQYFDFETAQSVLPLTGNEDSGLSVTLDWELQGMILTSITGYRSYESHDSGDADFTDLDTFFRASRADQTAWTQELRVSGDSGRWSYVAGLYYFRQDLDNVYTLELGESANSFFSHGFIYFPGTNFQFPLEAVPSFPLPDLPLFNPNGGSRNFMEQDHEAYAVFGQADYDLTDRLVVTGGLRYTYEQKELAGRFIQGSAPDFTDNRVGLPDVVANFPALAPQDPVDESLSDDHVTGTAKITWFFRDWGMVYASYGTGFKSAGTNTDRIDPDFDYVFDSETSQALEVGFKGHFPKHRLRLNVALHRTDIDDLQVTAFTDTGFFLQNAGRVETWGGELDVSWLPTDSLQLTGGYAKTVGEFRDFENGPCWLPAPFHTGRPDPGDPTGGANTTACDRSGDDLDQNPDFLFLRAKQSFGLTDDLSGHVLAEYSHVGESEVASNDPFLRAPSYELLNLRLALRFERSDIDLTVWGRNVLDEQYRMAGFNPVAANGRVVAVPREPTTWGVTLRKNF